MNKKKILFLSAQEIKEAISIERAIETMKDAFVKISSRKAVVPLRTSLDIKEHNGSALFMPVYLPGTDKAGLKAVTVFKDNPSRNLPMINAVMILFDAENGSPVSIMDGEYLTAMRTGAASGLATDLLSRKDSEICAIIGAGAQGRTQLEAVCAVRKIKKAFVFDLFSERAQQYVSEMSQKLQIPVEIIKETSALKDADIICTSTSSSNPVFLDSDLKEGVHINGIGSYRPDMCEIPHETVKRAKVVVGSRDACLSEAGDLIQAIEKGFITKEHIYAELGQVVLNQLPARENEKEVTFFKSVGNAAQDLTVANLAYESCLKAGLGQILCL